MLKEEEGLHDLGMNSYAIWVDILVAWRKQDISKDLDSTIYVFRVLVKARIGERD